jgi:hypothetical protein
MRTRLLAALLFGACGAGCGSAGGADAALLIDSAPPGGEFQLAWTINDIPADSSCTPVGATFVELTWIPTSGGSGANDSFTCTLGAGTTDRVEPQAYRVSATLGAGSAELDEQMLGTFTIVDGQVTDLGTVAFTASETGGFSMQLDADAPGANCAAETEMPAGAGITAWTLEASREGTCVELSITVEDGPQSGAAGGSYDLGCPGAALPCIENDQVISAAGLQSGAWALDIVGLEGAEECYPRRDSSFLVPGGDQVNALGSLTVELDIDNEACVEP